MNKNKAMVLAAGLGTRLRPLTDLISKPMAPIVNKPVMEHIIELLVKHNFKDVVCNLHWYPEAIKDYFGDGSRWGLSISYSYEEFLMGTAGGAKNVEDFFECQTFLIISGDALTDIDLTEVFKFHKRKGGIATLVLTEVDDPSQYGVVILDKEDKIVGFQEKPLAGEEKSNLANSGIYVFESDIFNYIQEKTFYDFGKNVFPDLLLKQIPYYGFKHSQYWNDVGGLEEYQRGNFDALEGKVKVNIPGKQIREGVWVGKNCRVQEEVVIIPPVCIGNSCTIKKGAKLFGPIILGDNTVVDERAVLYRGIKWGSGYIGKDASLIGAIIGYNAKIKDKASVLEKAVIGSKSIIGDGIIIHPSVKIMSNEVIK
ncbi:MAG: NDP-sugar synthase [Actinobacteria bacterium]|nr:NDP-sugar synthase [Actinomycetota bacterium]MBM3713261.1 NDP-sugar synthase [Actinomycetota bacterium]